MSSRRAPFAYRKTSELLRYAAGLLRAGDLTIEHQVADELDARAIWIEVARHDTGVSQERRLGVAAIEDGPTS